MLYIIGLGLGDERDITLRGLEAVKKSQKVYMEAYTSLLSFGLSPNGLSNLVRLSKPNDFGFTSFPILFIKGFMFLYVICFRKSFMGNQLYLLIEKWWRKRQAI